MHNSHQQKKWSNYAKGIVSDATLAFLTDECGCWEGERNKERNCYPGLNSDKWENKLII